MKKLRFCRIGGTWSQALIFVIIIVVLTFTIQAQGISVEGRVVDVHGKPVIGAMAVLLKNHGLDSTNSSGNFSISSAAGSHLPAHIVARGKLTFELRKNRLVFENSQATAFEFELVSLNGRRIYTLRMADVPAGRHLFNCPLEKLSAGLYVARIHYPGHQISKALVCTQASGWQFTILIGNYGSNGYYKNETSVAVDTLMIYKKGFKSSYIPLETNDVSLGDQTLNSDTVHNEKYVIFFRDSLAEAVSATSGWVFDPVLKTFTKKHDFTRSSWAPTLLLSPQIPDYVSHQVNTPTSYGLGTVLYKINYCTWEIDSVYRAAQIVELGTSPTKIYFGTEKGKMMLDRQTGRIDTMKAFNIVWRFEDLWLINKNKVDTAYLFSPAENRIKKTMFSSEGFAASDKYFISDNKRYMAQIKAIKEMPPFAVTVSEKSRIILFSLDNDSAYRFPISIYCASGSGVPVVYMSIHCGFVGESYFNYISATRDYDTLGPSFSVAGMAERCEMVSINLQTLTSTRQPATAAMFASKFNPTYVPPYLDGLRGKFSDEGQLVKEFLELFGDTASGYNYGISPDGKRFLGRFGITQGSSGSSIGFIYGDMENRWIERLPDPGNNLTGSFTEIYLYAILDTCDRTENRY
jgi:hypothetical protein